MPTILESWRKSWSQYLGTNAANRKPGYIGRFPYLLALRALVIVTIAVRFFLIPGAKRIGTNWDVLILIVVMCGELAAIWRITWPPEEETSEREKRIMISLIFVDVALISRAYYLTNTATSDFFLFYYLPMLTATEYLDLRFVPLTMASIIAGFTMALRKMGGDSPLGPWDLVVLATMRAGFLLCFAAISLVLTRLEQTQRRFLGNQKKQVTSLVEAQRNANQEFAVENVVDLVLSKAATLEFAAFAGMWFPDPAFVGMNETLRSPDLQLSSGRRADVTRICEKCIPEKEISRGTVGEAQVVAVPISIFNAVVGALFVGSGPAQRLLSERDSFLESLAEIAGGAIARIKRIKIFRDASLAAAETIQNDAKLEAALRKLTAPGHFDRAAIWAVNRYDNTLEMVRSRNIPPAWIQSAKCSLTKMDEDVLVPVIQRKETLVREGRHCLVSAVIYERFDNGDLTHVYAPILNGGSVAGILQAVYRSKREAEAGTEENLQSVESLGRELGEAVAHIQPYVMLEMIADRAREAIGAHSAAVQIYGGDRRIEQKAAVNRLSPTADTTFITRHWEEHWKLGCLAVVAKKCQVSALERLRADYPGLYQEGIRAIAAFPMNLGGRRTGALFLHFWNPPHVFTTAEIELERSFVGVLEATLLNQQLLDRVAGRANWAWVASAEQRAVHLLTTANLNLKEVLEEIAENILRVFGADSVVLYEFVQPSRTFLPPVIKGQFESEPAVSLTKASVPWRLLGPDERNAKHRFLDDVYREGRYGGFAGREGIRSCAALILRAQDGDEIAGVMFVNYRQQQSFPPESQDVVAALASSCAIAILTARLQERANQGFSRWKREMEALSEIDNMIATNFRELDLDTFVAMILGHAMKITRARDGAIYLLNRETGILTERRRDGFGKANLPDQRLGHGIIGQVALDGNSVMTSSDADPPYSPLMPDTQSELAVPLKDDVGVLGVFKLEHPERKFFDKDHQALVELLAFQGQIVVLTRDLFRQFQNQRGALDAFRTIAGRLQRADFKLDIQLRLILTGITAAGGLSFTRGMLFLFGPDGVDLHGHLAVGPLDATEARSIWEKLAMQDSSMDHLLDKSIQFSFGVEAGASDAPLSAAIRRIRYLPSGTDAIPDALGSGDAKKVPASSPHPIRTLLELARPAVDQEEEFAFVPLGARNEKPLGVLVVDRVFNNPPKAIHEVDLGLLQIFAELVAIAVRADRFGDKLKDEGRMKEWEQWIAGVIHALGTPIGKADAAVSNFRHHYDRSNRSMPEASQRLCDVIEDQLGRVANAQDQILRYARPVVPFQTVDLGKLIEDVVRTSVARIRCEIPPETLEIWGDADRFGEVLDNLINNSVEAMQGLPGKSVDDLTVEVKLTVEEAGDDGRKVVLEIADNAGGIPPAMREGLFDRYNSSKGKGRGLGLPIVKRIVEGHGGKIVEIGETSRYGIGVHFVIHLPALAFEPRKEDTYG